MTSLVRGDNMNGSDLTNEGCGGAVDGWIEPGTWLSHPAAVRPARLVDRQRSLAKIWGREETQMASIWSCHCRVYQGNYLHERWGLNAINLDELIGHKQHFG